MPIMVTTPCQENSINELGIKGLQIWTCDVSLLSWVITIKRVVYWLRMKLS